MRYPMIFRRGVVRFSTDEAYPVFNPKYRFFRFSINLKVSTAKQTETSAEVSICL